MLVVGLIVLLDSPYPIPFPLVGLPSVIVSAVLVFWAVYRLYRGCGLPLREVAIYLAMKGGEASRTEILEFLEGEEGKGDQLFEILEKKVDCHFGYSQFGNGRGKGCDSGRFGSFAARRKEVGERLN